MITLKKILVPTDFSEHSSKALRYGAELAAKFGADLHIVHAIELMPIAYGEVWPRDARIWPVRSGAGRGYQLSV